MKLILLPQAQADLDAVPDALFPRLWKRIETLGRYPRLGATMEGAFAEYRNTVASSYRIVYREAPHAIVICYIRHCRRS